MKRWNVVSVPLEQTSRDTRQESWKVQGSKDEWPRLAEKIVLVDKISRRDQLTFPGRLYDEFGVGCIQDLNDKQLSLGLVKPTVLDCCMADREKVKHTVQTTLDSDTPFLTIANYPKQPRVRYRCADCKSTNPHDQQIIEWGAYEFMRRNPDRPPEQCLTGLRLMNASYDKYFLVGNLAKHRTSFVVVSVFRFKAS